MSDSNQRPRQAPAIPIVKNAAYVAKLGNAESLLHAGEFVPPYALAKFIADTLMHIADPLSATVAQRQRHAVVVGKHLEALIEQIKSGAMDAFDEDGAKTAAYALGTVIRRTDAAKYAADMGLKFGEAAPAIAEPVKATATPSPVVAAMTRVRKPKGERMATH